MLISVWGWANKSNLAIASSEPSKEITLGDVDNSRQGLYQIIAENYSEKNESRDVEITYPQISGLKDSDLQARINNLLKSEALKSVLNSDARFLRLRIKHKISWQGERLLSVQYNGSVYVQGAPYLPSLFYTTNIDVLNGSKIRLQDVVSIDESFVAKYRDKKVKPIRMNELIDGEKVFVTMFGTGNKTSDETIELFNKADSTYPNAAIYCYFTPESLGISVAVAHYFGDHIEFEVDYKNIADNIKADNQVWKDFFTRPQVVVF